MTEQLDIFATLEANERAERAAHLPRTFIASDEYTPQELADAKTAWWDEHWHMKQPPAPRMWDHSICQPFGSGTAHSVWVMAADLGCRHFNTDCYCVGDRVYRAYCSDCQWWTPIAEHEDEAIRAYHDHCWPGWRSLPICTRPNLEKPPKLPADYPQEWQVPGAPILTHRKWPGTRNVPGRSPFGGYDMTDPKCLEKK